MCLASDVLQVAEPFPDDWEYFELNPHCAAEFAPVEGDLYELMIVVRSLFGLWKVHCNDVYKQKKPTQDLPIVNSTWNGLDAYSTNDLLKKHPTKPGVWKIYGRADDQITLANGLKVSTPLIMMCRAQPDYLQTNASPIGMSA